MQYVPTTTSSITHATLRAPCYTWLHNY